jgi:double-strand break repair protein MRE11
VLHNPFGLGRDLTFRHVGLLSITGKDFHLEKIRLKTVRPFIMREITLSEVPRFAKKASDKGKEAVLAYLREQVEECIAEAKVQWTESQSPDTETEPPLPLVRLRVEYTGPFEVENPQRFSNKFVGKVANTTDVVQFYRKKRGTNAAKRAATTMDLPEDVREGEEAEGDEEAGKVIRVEDLVREFLNAQTLSVLEETGLGMAVENFVDKDDKRALQDFVEDTLKEHVEVPPPRCFR